MGEVSSELDRYLRPAKVCLCFHLKRSARVVSQLYDEALRPVKIRATQFSLLVGIRAMSPVTIQTLARAMGMDRTTLTRNVQPLKRRKLIALSIGRDRREREVTLTPAGQEKLAEALPLWEKVQSKVQAMMGGEASLTAVKNVSAAVLQFSETEG